MTEFKHTPDSLADQLDVMLPAGETAYPISDPDPLVDAALQIASLPRPGLPDATKTRIQTQILQHARHQREPVRPHVAPILRWALIACAVLIVALVPATQITLASVPGEPLYLVKRTIEQIETGLANSPATRASVSLTHAERRTQEAQILLTRGQFDPALIAAAYTDMASAAEIIRTQTDFDPGLRLIMQSQTAALVAAIDSLLVSATQPDQPLAATVMPLVADIIATQNSGALLLPATVTTEPSPMPATPTPVAPTALVTPALLPEASPTEMLPVNLIVEGPIEAISGNVIVIYGIEIQFDPSDPILLILQIGDRIRVSSSVMDGASVVVTGVEVEPADESVAISEDGQTVWRDSGNCSNPPPAWAPANGWRRRCENQPNNSNTRQGQGQNQGQGRGQGRGQGNGNSDDDD